MSLQITAVYASLLALLIIGLSVRIIIFRRTLLVGIGDGGDKAMKRAIRVQANATEYVPTFLILMACAEANGLAALYLHLIGGMVVFARVCHAMGLSKYAGTSIARVLGTSLTFTGMIGLAIYNLVSFFG